MADKTNMSLENVLDDINAKIAHVEDIEADTRKLLIQLVKQGNQIVKFLQGLEIQDISDDFEEEFSLSSKDSEDSTKFKHVKELLDEYMKENMSELKEFEEEIEKHKENITPGQIGES